jgi:hypothetical protein
VVLEPEEVLLDGLFSLVSLLSLGLSLGFVEPPDSEPDEDDDSEEEPDSELALFSEFDDAALAVVADLRLSVL